MWCFFYFFVLCYLFLRNRDNIGKLFTLMFIFKQRRKVQKDGEIPGLASWVTRKKVPVELFFSGKNTCSRPVESSCKIVC